jgi:hypothetical protein
MIKESLQILRYGSKKLLKMAMFSGIVSWGTRTPRMALSAAPMSSKYLGLLL